MPSDKAVLDVIEQWSGKRPERMSQNLEEWWNLTAPGSSHSTLSYDPNGIEDLVRRLKKAFPSAPALESGDFASTGGIKTVQELSMALLSPVAADLALPPAAPKKRARKAAAKAAKRVKSGRGARRKPTAKRK